jgi:two-component system sensor histidine kinase KdpD
MGLDWHAAFVDAPSQQKVRPAEREQALRALRLAQELGATTATPIGADVVHTLAAYAREHNLSRLVIGRRLDRRLGLHGWRRLWPSFGRMPLTEHLSQATPDMDVLLVPLSAQPASKKTTDAASTVASQQPWLGYGVAALACTAVAVLASPLRSVLELTNIVMLFLLVVVGVALRYGRQPAAFAAFLGVALFDVFFVPPLLSFHVGDVQYVLTFAVMLLVALVIGQLTANLRAQARAAAERERRVRGLYDLSRELSAALLSEQIGEIAAAFVRTEFAAPSAVLLADDNDRLQAQTGASAQVDMAVAQWCFERGEAAGRSTNTLPASSCLMLPLKGPMRLRGVLAVEIAKDRLLSPEQRQLLDTCASLLAISIERIHYIEVAQSSTVQMESERLRNSLLAALSHDLRTPLAALLGLSETLNSSQPALSAAQREMSAGIMQLAQRMVAQVGNLLDMARLESGSVHLRCEWQPLEEVLSSALASSQASLGQRQLLIKLPPDLPLLHLDASLFERVLINLLENAAKYTADTANLSLSARSNEKTVSIVLDDDGPGLPLGREETVFEKFERGSKEAAAPGVGLGLAICRAIVQAHGGSIKGENRMVAGRVVGARFTITLARGLPPSDDGSLALPPLESALPTTSAPPTASALTTNPA